MAKVYVFTDGETLTLSDDPVKEWRAEVLHVMLEIKLGYFEQGYNTISAREATKILINSDEITIVVGDTWIAGFSFEEPWHLKDKFVIEEFYGARKGKKMDLEDFIAAGTALGHMHGCRFFEFGTRSNERHSALAKLASRYGAYTSAITLQKEIE